MAGKGKFDALLAAIASGGTAGFADEIDGGLQAAHEAAMDSDSLMGFFDQVGANYEKNRDASRRSRAQMAAEHPVIDAVGEGIGTGLAAVALSPLAALGVTGRGAAALGGAMEGLGRTDDSTLQGLTKASTGGAAAALVGGKVLEGTLKLAGKGASKLTGLLDAGKAQPARPVLEAPPTPRPGFANATGEDVARKAEAGAKLDALLKDTYIPPTRVSKAPEPTAPYRSELTGSPFAKLPRLRTEAVQAPEQAAWHSGAQNEARTEMFGPENQASLLELKARFDKLNPDSFKAPKQAPWEDDPLKALRELYDDGSPGTVNLKGPSKKKDGK